MKIRRTFFVGICFLGMALVACTTRTKTLSSAAVLFRNGDYEGAIKASSQEIQLDPNNAIAYNTRGAAQASIGRYKEAIVDLSTAIRLDPNLAIAYCNRGDSLRQLAEGNIWMAKRDFVTALKLATQQKDQPLINHIKKLRRSGTTYGFEFHPHEILGGANARHRLKQYGYNIQKTDGGYLLTRDREENIPAGDRRIISDERFCQIGKVGGNLMKGRAAWSVDSDGKIWLAVRTN